MGYRLAGLVGVEDLPKSPIMYIMSTKSDVGWLMPTAGRSPALSPSHQRCCTGGTPRGVARQPLDWMVTARRSDATVGIGRPDW